MMKKQTLSFLCALVIMFTSFKAVAQNNSLAGAWHHQDQNIEHVIVFIDGYFTHSVFNKKDKQFHFSRGGTYTQQGNDIRVTWQFDSKKAAEAGSNDTWVGQTTTFKAQAGKQLQSNISGADVAWTKIDDNQADLAGVWRISGRQTENGMSNSTLGDRRTLKILTGTRFQWAAINIKTGEFFGTGGGQYTFKNGTYTENIEFFSRDNSRVGATLDFKGEVRDGQWHHSGKSSAGAPLHEVWIKLERNQ